MFKKLTEAKNIGEKVAKRLNEIGVFSLEDLDKLTSPEAYKKICKNYPDETVPVCYYLYSLEGALRNQHWNDLPTALKMNLKKSAGK